MATTVQLRCYWKQLWSRWAITGSWEPLVLKLECFSWKSLYVHQFLYFKREFFKTLHPCLLPYNEMHILTEVCSDHIWWVIVVFCVEYLIKNVERTPPKWEFLKTLSYYHMKICILLSRFDWNIFEGGIVLFESEYFIEKKSFYTKILLYFKWKLQIIFLKIWKIWGWSRGRHCFCVKNNLELMPKLSWKIKQLVDEYLTTYKM